MFFSIIFYKITSETRYVPANVQPKDFLSFYGPQFIEEGSYLRAKTAEQNNCVDYKIFSQKYFCDIGWNYLNYIHLIQTQDLNDPNAYNSLTPKSISEAIALGGAINYTQMGISIDQFDSELKPYIYQGYGFYSLYSMHKLGFDYPLVKFCQGKQNQDSCWFGIGEASFYSSYKREDLKFSEAALNGFDFASMYGGRQNPTEKNIFHNFAIKLTELDENKENNLLICLKKNHYLACAKELN